jgi:hypothetical protein
MSEKVAKATGFLQWASQASLLIFFEETKEAPLCLNSFFQEVLSLSAS